MMKPEELVGLKKFYNVNTDVELIEAQAGHIKKLQDEISAGKVPQKAVHERVRKA